MTFWKWPGESRYPGAFPPTFPPVLEQFRRAFSPGPTDRPWVSEDALIVNLKYAQVTIRFRAQNNFRMVARHDDRPKKFLLG